jgi:hypothetical protein
LGSPLAKPTIQHRLDTQRITGPQPKPRPLFLKKGSGIPSVLKLRRFQLATSLATRCRALFGARSRRIGAELARTRPPSHMTTEEIEGVVRALTAVVENLEADAAKQSMQEAFLQVRAYAGESKPREPNRPAAID